MKLPLILTSAMLGTSMFLNNTSPGSLCKVPTETKKRSGSGKILPVGTVYIVIDKSDYELNVYDEKGWYATYPVVFGNNSLDDKKMEGDRCTPEGEFHIVSKKFMINGTVSWRLITPQEIATKDFACVS